MFPHRRKTMIIGLKGDCGRAVTVQAEKYPSGSFSLCGYPVSGKTVFDSLKSTGHCPPNDSGGPVIGLNEAGVLSELMFELFDQDDDPVSEILIGIDKAGQLPYKG